MSSREEVAEPKFEPTSVCPQSPALTLYAVLPSWYAPHAARGPVVFSAFTGLRQLTFLHVLSVYLGGAAASLGECVFPAKHLMSLT